MITKRKRVEDGTAGIAPEDILPVNKRGPRAQSSNDYRKKLAKSFEICTLEVGTLRSNVIRSESPQVRQMQMVTQLFCL